MPVYGGSAGVPAATAVLPPRFSTRWYRWRPTGVNQAQANSADATFYACPRWFGRATTLTTLGLRVNSPASSGGLARIMLYSDDGTGYPGALLLDAGTVDTTVGGDKTVSVNQAIPAGTTVWIAALFYGNPTTKAAFVQISPVQSVGDDTTWFATSAAIVGQSPVWQYSGAQAGTAAPTTAPASMTASGTAIDFFYQATTP